VELKRAKILHIKGHLFALFIVIVNLESCTVASESIARLLIDGGLNYSATMIIPASSDPNLMNKGSLDSPHQDESNVSCVMSLGSIDAEI
jgi:hypothetical protein